MKLAIISFAREGSKRLPRKNTMLLNGHPLIWYTLQTMKYIKDNYKEHDLECYVLTDYEECKKICEDEGIKVIWRDHPKEWDDITLNKWAHKKINADAYLLLQPTSPFRNSFDILVDLESCINFNYYSVCYVVKKDKLNFKRSGSFFYYLSEMLVRDTIFDNGTVLFQDNIDIDIDTIEDFNEAEKYAKQNNIGSML